MKISGISSLLAALFLSIPIVAQHQVRDSDHFWRKRVVTRVSMVEKINRPIVYHESNVYGDKGYAEKNGLVVSLLNGVKEGKYKAYHEDDWKIELNYEALLDRMKNNDPSSENELEDWEREEVDIDDGFESYDDDFAYESDEDLWKPAPISGIDETEEFGERSTSWDEEKYEIDYNPYEQVMHIVEDYIFDRNRSKMLRNIDFIEIIWQDPTGSLPEKVLGRFRWEDVAEQLENTQWKNRYNDAEIRSLKEVFVMRLFNGFFISYGGEPINSLAEAEIRRQQLVEFEHNLWSY